MNEENGNETPAPRSRLKELAAHMGYAVPVWIYLAGAVGGAGLLARATVRDRYLVPGLLFYATPWAVLLTVALLWTIWQAGNRRKTAALVGALLVLVLGGTWFGRNYYHRAAQPPEDAVRFMFWNSARLRSGLEPVVEHIRTQQADVVALVESAVHNMGEKDFFYEAFPYHNVQFLPGGMLLITRAEILSTRYVKSVDESRFNIVELSIDGENLTVVIVDINSNPLYNRREAISATFAQIEALGAEACVVAGDFNTPLRSAHFDSVRESWQHAFQTSGTGWVETWPGAVPLLAIDHVWLTGYVRAASCHHQIAACSDHQSVITELVIGQP